MYYVIGVGLALGLAAVATLTGLDRRRGYYPIMMVVIASFYDLFALVGDGAQVLGVETGVLAVFIGVSFIGFKTNPWVIVVSLLAHGAFDLVHAQLIANPGVPFWWPMFCLSFDAAAAGYLAWRLFSASSQSPGRDGFAGPPVIHVDDLAAPISALRQ